MKIKILPVLLLGVFIFNSNKTHAQKAIFDSLWTIWETESLSDSLRARAHYYYIWNHNDLDSLERLCKEFAPIANKLSPCYYYPKVYGLLNWTKKNKTQPDSAIYYANIGLNRSISCNNTELNIDLHNRVGEVYYQFYDNKDSTLKHFKLALQNAYEYGDTSNILTCLGWCISSVIYFERDYNQALIYLDEYEKYVPNDKSSPLYANYLDQRSRVNFAIQEYDVAIDYYIELKEFYADNIYAQVNLCNSISLVYTFQKKYAQADSMLIHEKEIIDRSGIEGLEKIDLLFKWHWHYWTLHYKSQQYAKSLDHSKEMLRLAKELNNESKIQSSKSCLGASNAQLGNYQQAIALVLESYKYHENNCPLFCLREDAETLYKSYKKLGDNKKALLYYEVLINLQDSIDNEDNQRAVIRSEYKYQYEKQALTDSLEFAKTEELKDLEIEKQQAELSQQRVGLAATGVGLLLIIALAISIYKGKKRSDELLLNILPEETAQELKSKGSAESKLIEDTTVLFTDFEGFTEMSENVTASALVKDINECFSAFDHIMEKHGVEKIKTIGDAYMAAGGVPTPSPTHVKDVVLAALEIADFMKDWAAQKEAKGEPHFDIRIGVNTGPVVAGIVGIKKFQYDIWGDTVNTANRMESAGEVGKVNISESTYYKLKD
ncbi:MAG: adenylate/guanylate cyclase domain-containing protein, partial [Schleiferiaceae bacterium]|nr:adenylate/guanylate cyclase domain-containing protein [Schleiferiaceae bacterium]